MYLLLGLIFATNMEAFACTPNAMDFCATSQCGPCSEGLGDCDPGQCAAGLTCVEEGAVDHCRPNVCAPSAMDFCASNRCGPCSEGEGDCDPGQCDPGLTCAEEGAVDHCRIIPLGNGDSNLQVQINNIWKPICCVNGDLEISDQDCLWTELNRRLTDETANMEFDCNEGNPQDCDCEYSNGENMHGDNGGSLWSIKNGNTGPVYSDYLMATCVTVDSNGNLKTQWTSPSCPEFRLE